MLVFLIALNTVLSLLLGAALAVLFDLRRLVPQKGAPTAPAPLPPPARDPDDDDPGAPDQGEGKPSTPQAYNW